MSESTKPVDLPPDVVASDLDWPGDNYLGYTQLQEMGLDSPDLLFFKTKDGWFLTTLLISKSRSKQASDRYYCVAVKDKKVWRIGRGPHVLQQITVRLSKVNVERLAKYVELWHVGAADAGTIRDRISSRRAQGQLRRDNLPDWFS